MNKSFEGSSFKEFEASVLFCPKCKEPVSVRKRLLIVLPDADKYEYLCSRCNSAVGTKLILHNKKNQLII